MQRVQRQRERGTHKKRRRHFYKNAAQQNTQKHKHVSTSRREQTRGLSTPAPSQQQQQQQRDERSRRRRRRVDELFFFIQAAATTTTTTTTTAKTFRFGIARRFCRQVPRGRVERPRRNRLGREERNGGDLHERKSERAAVWIFKRCVPHFRPLRDSVRVEKRVSLGRFAKRNQIFFQLADYSSSVRRRRVFGRERYSDDHAPRRELEERVRESWVDGENKRIIPRGMDLKFQASNARAGASRKEQVKVAFNCCLKSCCVIYIFT